MLSFDKVFVITSYVYISEYVYSLSEVRVVTFIGKDRGANEGGFPIVCRIIVLVELMDEDKVTTIYEMFVLVNKHGV